MSEFRQNPITKNWVLIAPSRGKRPDQYKTYSVMHGVPETDEKCVFCPGNEELNGEIIAYNSLGQALPKHSKDWEIRIIPNKFASLEHTIDYQRKEFYVR